MSSNPICSIFADIPKTDERPYDFLSSLFIYNMEVLIAHLKSYLLDCFNWESNHCPVKDVRLLSDANRYYDFSLLIA